MKEERYYPVGIQTFSELRKGGYVYVDKTDLMWTVQNRAKYVFLSRPRRFGKSLLSTTFEAFFKAERELFEGLKVMKLERDWVEYPVLHLDLSGTKHLKAEGVKDELVRILMPYENIYGRQENETSPGMRLSGLIARAFAKTGRQVVVIIDEYDASLLDNLHSVAELEAVREVMQEFYQRLKMDERMIHFCFITGITKFSQLSIFSTINNLTDISMNPDFATICGITEAELNSVLTEDVERLAEYEGTTAEDIHAKLKDRYDGYRFSKISVEIYNPYSLFLAFFNKEIRNYWYDSGTPSFLMRELQHYHTDITALENIEAPVMAFDIPTEKMTDALPLLYQSGYLTIKGYDRETETYLLSIPNREVRIGLTYGLLPLYTGLNSSEVQMGFAAKFWQALKADDIERALREMQTYFAGLPYIEEFKKRLGDVAKVEGFYEWTFNLIFSMLNVYVRTQVKTIHGRADMVVHMPTAIYVMELKINGTAQEALEQIDKQGYAVPYMTDGRQVVKVGIRFSTDKLGIEDWVVRK
ncbi:MAG: ATP-binding protein [Bacteroidaceae bacterium]|nr:ATP-binding protein [Bacteroidaceae bacterium]